ncbi:hypothetical protein AAY473_035409 [Plecturocebus cupreus]
MRDQEDIRVPDQARGSSARHKVGVRACVAEMYPGSELATLNDETDPGMSTSMCAKARDGLTPRGDSPSSRRTAVLQTPAATTQIVFSRDGTSCVTTSSVISPSLSHLVTSRIPIPAYILRLSIIHPETAMNAWYPKTGCLAKYTGKVANKNPPGYPRTLTSVHTSLSGRRNREMSLLSPTFMATTFSNIQKNGRSSPSLGRPPSGLLTLRPMPAVHIHLNDSRDRGSSKALFTRVFPWCAEDPETPSNLVGSKWLLLRLLNLDQWSGDIGSPGTPREKDAHHIGLSWLDSHLRDHCMGFHQSPSRMGPILQSERERVRMRVLMEGKRVGSTSRIFLGARYEPSHQANHRFSSTTVPWGLRDEAYMQVSGCGGLGSTEGPQGTDCPHIFLCDVPHVIHVFDVPLVLHGSNSDGLLTHFGGDHFGRPKWADHLRSGVRDQPNQHGETASLLKIQKLARDGGEHL